MIPYERRQMILSLLEGKDFVTIEQLIDEIEGASESTIRRDLKTLFDEGQIHLMRGGASKANEGSQDTLVNSRLLLNKDVSLDRLVRKRMNLISIFRPKPFDDADAGEGG